MGVILVAAVFVGVLAWLVVAAAFFWAVFDNLDAENAAARVTVWTLLGRAARACLQALGLGRRA